MKEPKPIKTAYSDIQIRIVGYKNPDTLPYLVIGNYGFIHDRDVKRLLTWCKECLRRRK